MKREAKKQMRKKVLAYYKVYTPQNWKRLMNWLNF